MMSGCQELRICGYKRTTPVSLTEDWINKMWYMHTVRYYSALNKERNYETCYNIDELQGHYAN